MHTHMCRYVFNSYQPSSPIKKLCLQFAGTLRAAALAKWLTLSQSLTELEECIGVPQADQIEKAKATPRSVYL